MEHLTFLLTGPGDFLVDFFLPASSWADQEARADLAVTLGIVCWVVAAVALRLAWHLAARSTRVMRLLQAGTALRCAYQARAMAWRRRLRVASSSVRRRRWTSREVWGIVWRAQAVHAAIYAGMPLLWEALRTAFVVITSPLWFIGPGGGYALTDGTLDHLQRPACWTFVTVCSGPRSEFLSARLSAVSVCGHAPCPPGRTLFGGAGNWVLKGFWAALTAAWGVNWMRRRGLHEPASTRQRRKPPPQ